MDNLTTALVFEKDGKTVVIKEGEKTRVKATRYGSTYILENVHFAYVNYDAYDEDIAVFADENSEVFSEFRFSQIEYIELMA